MFNEINLGNRLRHFVRGRVLVFTTSPTVEFIDEQLTQSLTLWGNIDQPLPVAAALTFSVELSGWLSFEPGSQVKIVELAPYNRGHYSPADFTIVYPPDPYLNKVLNSYPQYPDGNGLSFTGEVVFATKNGNGGRVEVQRKPVAAFTAQQFNKDFGIGKFFIFSNLPKGWQAAQF